MKTEKDCRDYLDEMTKILEEMKTDIGNGQKIINVSGMSKKEKEEIINKRNCLVTQIYMLKWFLEEVEED